MGKSKRKKASHKSKTGKRRSEKTGLPPGVLMHIGKAYEGDIVVRLTSYNETEIKEKNVLDPGELSTLEPDLRHWIEVCGLSNTEIIGRVGQIFDIHTLLLEDILNTDQRPKAEDFTGYIFLTFKAMSFKEEGDESTLESEQISIVTGGNYIISFQESDNKMLEAVKERLRQSRGKIRSKGTDYLTFALVDLVVDNYYSLLESVSDKLEDLEEAIFDDPEEGMLGENQLIKKDILILRKMIMPLREALHKLELFDSDLIDDKTTKYFNDVYDHTSQIIENIETYREVSSELKDIYLSSISYRMNQVMKVLTIVATVFIPLTFIVGIYGMNFQFMPELQWKYAYPLIWGIMLVVAAGMIYYFRRKKWF